MLKREESRHDFAFMAGVVIGAVAGAIATLALTPMSGAETRERLRARTGDLGAVRKRAGTVASSAQAVVSPMRDRVVELTSKLPRPTAGETGEEGAPPRVDSQEPVEGSPAIVDSGPERATSDAPPVGG
jgi:gas vesicle protein